MTLTDVLFLFANPRRSENKIPPDSVESKRIEGGGEDVFQTRTAFNDILSRRNGDRSNFEADTN